MTSYVGAVDQGTTSTRFIIFDDRARVVAVDRADQTQIYPKPGWVENDPSEIWENTVRVISGAMAKAGLAPGDLAAVGITNQRETTVVWDRESGRPLANGISWQDTRTAELVTELAGADGPDRYRDVTGLPLATYFSGPKVRWLLDRVDGLETKAESGDVAFGTIDSWIAWNLTGGAHLTDVSNASRTMLMNLHTLDWDSALLRSMGVPRAVLPEIRPSSADLAICATPLPEVPLAGILGDQQAALFGQACFDVGEVKNTYGTGCFMLLNTGPAPIPSDHGLLTTVAYQLDGAPTVYALEGSVAIAGALVQWLRDNLGIIEKSEDVEELAASVEDTGDVYFVPAFSGLFAPHWRSDARGVIVGLTRYTSAAHLARAALEATAFQTRDVIEAMKADSGTDLVELRVDGGMVANDLLMHFQADVLGLPVVRPAITETTALGAAYAAGLASSVWESTDELRDHWEENGRWTPSMSEPERARRYERWSEAVERSHGWA